MFDSITNKTKLFEESLGIIDGLFLLFLAISGNFLAETLGCQTQELFTNSIIAKQIMTFFIIYFTIDFSDKNIEDPGTKLTKAGLVYLFFLLFTKMDLKPTVLVFVLLFGIYVSTSYKKYYEAKFKQNDKPSKEDKNTHSEKMASMIQTQKTLMGIVVVTILAGFFMYYREKKIEYKETFNLQKFIFGVVKCKGMN
jgi:Ca2+/Na+ antiporter|tara:strand:+ start:534 stop:1121 length:588 start_codon:yes stop_codon:yes gene_type:complete